jgi:hypothetical protein
MRIRTVLATLSIACLAALVPTAANASTNSGAVRANDSASLAIQADGTRVTGVAPQSVTVLDSGNDGAWVSGVGYCSNINVNADCWTWVNTSGTTVCPAGHFCIATNVHYYEGGKIFSFYHCRNGGSDWALQGWNGTGLYANGNTGGASAYIKNINHVTINPPGPIPVGAVDDFNFVPAYYIQAC